MIRMLIVALAVTGLFLTACSQEQPPAPAQPKMEAKPAVEPVAPVPPTPAVTPAAPATPAPPAAASTAAKPAAPVVETPKAPEPVAKPPEPAAPAKVAPVAPAKPAVKIPDAPETVVLAASQGQVTLPHLVHAKLFPCASCHGDGTPGKIALTKETAHELCRECHKAKGAGPTACGGCHKK